MEGRFGLDGDHLGDGRGLVREVEAAAGAELDDRTTKSSSSHISAP
jgi:hypothetical protein